MSGLYEIDFDLANQENDHTHYSHQSDHKSRFVVSLTLLDLLHRVDRYCHYSLRVGDGSQAGGLRLPVMTSSTTALHPPRVNAVRRIHPAVARTAFARHLPVAGSNPHEQPDQGQRDRTVTEHGSPPVPRGSSERVIQGGTSAVPHRRVHHTRGPGSRATGSWFRILSC